MSSFIIAPKAQGTQRGKHCCGHAVNAHTLVSVYIVPKRHVHRLNILIDSLGKGYVNR